MEWEGRGRMRPFLDLKYYLVTCLVGLRKNHEKSQRGSAASGPRFEAEISRIRCWTASHLTKTFGKHQSSVVFTELINPCDLFRESRSVIFNKTNGQFRQEVSQSKTIGLVVKSLIQHTGVSHRFSRLVLNMT